MVHWLMAGCWLILACVLLAWQWFNSAVPSANIWGTHIPLGWLAVAMALYNLLRGWLDRSGKATMHKRSAKEAGEPHPPLDRKESHPPAAVAPNFDFTTDPRRSP